MTAETPEAAAARAFAGAWATAETRKEMLAYAERVIVGSDRDAARLGFAVVVEIVAALKGDRDA